MEQPGPMIHRSPLGIIGPIDQTPNAEMRDGRCTHRARLQRHDQRATLQPGRPTLPGSLPHGQKLCMSAGIVLFFHMIAGHSQNMTLLIQHHSPNRHFPCTGSFIRQCKSLLHGLP